MNKDFLDHPNFPGHIPKDSNEMENEVFLPDQLVSISEMRLLNQVRMCLNFFVRWINQGIEVQHAQSSSSERNSLFEIPELEIFMGP